MRFFGQHIHPAYLILATTEYGLAALAFVIAVSLLLPGGVSLAAEAGSDIWPLVFAFSSAVVIGSTAVGLYQARQRLGPGGVVVRLTAAICVGVVISGAVALLYDGPRSVELWVAAFATSLILLGSARALFSKVVDHDAFRRRVLVYGAGDRAASLLKLRRRSDQRGFRVAGFVPAPGDRCVIDDDRVLATSGSLLDLAKRLDVSEIVVAMDERRNGFPVKDLLDCKFSGIAIIDVLTFLERETGKVKVDLVNPAWLIFSDGFGEQRSLSAFASRMLDFVVSLVLAILSLPAMLIVAAAIVIEDGFPVLYRQKRVGLGGRTFTLYKFRSMVKDAEAGGRAQWASKDDPRVTKVGRIIRKLRFDELPQLFNVIRGDMSLVGPRPERPEFVERLSTMIPYYHERHCVKPGVTGWAQLCYPYGSSDQDAMEKLQYDLYYVKHRNLIFDLMVLLQTVEVILWGKGAR